MMRLKKTHLGGAADLSSVIQEQFHDLDFVLLAGNMQRRESILKSTKTRRCYKTIHCNIDVWSEKGVIRPHRGGMSGFMNRMEDLISAKKLY